ncbi:MAG: hypothetical protein U5N86_04260 [Planctomycetota bacterium]|nr:hypothetical protein [Planctomycetota bacterium]
MRKNLFALFLSVVLLFAFAGVHAEQEFEKPAEPEKLERDKKKELFELVEDYFKASDVAEELKLLHKLDRYGSLNRSDFRSLDRHVWKIVAQLPKPEKARGTIDVDSPFGSTKVIISGRTNPRSGGLLLGLHGGGKGSGDGSQAAGSFGGAKKCISLFPTAIDKIDNAWNDPPQERFLTWLIKFIRRKEPYNTNRVYVCGHSMGGHGAYGQLLQYADLYASGFASAGNPLVEDTLDHYGDARHLAVNLYNIPIYFAHSHDDPRVAVKPVLEWAKVLKTLHKEHPKGYEYVFSEERDNAHNFPKEGVKHCIDWMTERERNPRPEKIRWMTFRKWKRHFYWVFCYQPERLKLVEAEYTDDSVVKVKTESMFSKMAVLFNEELIDYDKPVKVTVNDRVVFEGYLQRYNVAAFVAAVKEYEDPEFTYDAKVIFQP